MQIGELSRRTGVSIRMLRYYEQQGLLRPRRPPSGYRDYGDADESMARNVRQLQSCGLKLSVVKRLLPCLLPDRAGFRPCAIAIASLQAELREIDERIACLRASREILAEVLADAN